MTLWAPLDAVCYDLFLEAERVRWRMDEIPFHAIDRARVTPALVTLVREAAFAELTTHSATRRFLQEFADDADLTQWIAVWFYEETKHPQALMTWLRAVGETFDERFLLRGRATAPFMRSRMGTLVTNIVSEIVASTSYRALGKGSPEPVLAGIADRLAGDEARHGASFFAYARRRLERADDPDEERLDALKVLYTWFMANDRVTHPVNEFHGRAASHPETAELATQLGVGLAAARTRVIQLIGVLCDLPLERAEDVRAQVETLSARKVRRPEEAR